MTQAEIMKKRDELAESLYPKPTIFQNNNNGILSPNGVSIENRKAYRAGFDAAIQLMLEREEKLRTALKEIGMTDDTGYGFEERADQALAEVEEWK